MKSTFPGRSSLSPHYETSASPTKTKSRFSRFSSRRSQTVRNLEGSLVKAEESVKTALAVKSHNGAGKVTKSAEMASRIQNTPDRSEQSNIREGSKTPVGSAQKNFEYFVDFDPGPIGLKLEPVLKNGTKEFGCRVMRLIDNGSDASPSQALKSGKIKVGDVLTAVNGKNVTSKSYSEIVSLLKSPSSETRGKRITFKVPRSPAPVMPKTPGRENLISSEEMNNSLGADNTTIVTPQQTLVEGKNNSPRVFSPSFVKEVTQSSAKNSNILSSPSKISSKSLSDILSTVMKNVAPKNDSKPTYVSSVLSKQIGKVLVGSSSKEVDETVHMKLELLTELSEAKASLGEQEVNMKMMTRIMEDIQKEKVTAQAEKETIQGTLTEVRKEKVRLRNSVRGSR